jgi:hypothetical protein
VFVQIDGGSENVAKTVLAMMELIISQRVTKKIVLCRLPVGHTHEDIDSKFAKIWTRVRNAHVLTIGQYMKFVHQVSITVVMKFSRYAHLFYRLFIGRPTRATSGMFTLFLILPGTSRIVLTLI